jgi:hypothetical protein
VGFNEGANELLGDVAGTAEQFPAFALDIVGLGRFPVAGNADMSGIMAQMPPRPVSRNRERIAAMREDEM